jgi:hypothetical protein
MNESEIRMDAKKWSLIAEIFGVKSRIEGMKTDNRARRDVGYADAYGAECFFSAEQDLITLSNRLKEEI